MFSTSNLVSPAIQWFVASEGAGFAMPSGVSADPNGSGNFAVTGTFDGERVSFGGELTCELLRIGLTLPDACLTLPHCLTGPFHTSNYVVIERPATGQWVGTTPRGPTGGRVLAWGNLKTNVKAP